MKIHPENPYVKIYLHKQNEIDKIYSVIEQLLTVNHVNITMNQSETRKSLVVYPMETCSAEEMVCEINKALNTFFQKNFYDGRFK